MTRSTLCSCYAATRPSNWC